MNFFQKFKETVYSVAPIMALVLILSLTIAPLPLNTLLLFLAGSILVIIGLTVFLFGVDLGILPIGERSGAALTSKRSLPLLLVASFLIGFMITIAEPDVQVLADQVRSVAPNVSKWALIVMIAAGVALFVAIGILRTVLSIPLRLVLIISYAIVFALAFLTPPTFQGVAFDSGGATTGPMTVPFIMALGVGVAAVRSKASKSGVESEDDSFGLTGIASVGPVAAVCLYGIILSFSAPDASGSISGDEMLDAEGISVFARLLPEILHEVSSALFPLVMMAVIFQIFLIKMPPFQVIRMVRGLFFSFAGLVLFLLGAKGGFMNAGKALGEVLGRIAISGKKSLVLFDAAGEIEKALNIPSVVPHILLIAVGCIFGAVVVSAEPAVWVLTDQVESVSGGAIKRRTLLSALSIGVALSIGISMARVIFGFSLWYILIPGYALSLLMTLFCPKLFTGIAFDSGGVASGPMTSTFIMSFTLGASNASGGNPAVDAFGVIALVAMTPLIAIQVLGIIFKAKTQRK